MASLSNLFNQACNSACSLAAVYPKNTFSVRFTLPKPGAYTGSGSWSSEKLTTTNVTMKGGVWVADEDGAGDGQLGVKFSSSGDVMFHVATGGLSVQEIDTDTLTQIYGSVKQRNDYNQLRFVVKLVAAKSYVCFGGVQKNSYTIITVSAQALEDAVAGKISSGISVADTNVTDINQNIFASSQLVPVGMLLYEFSEHHGLVVNNASQ